MEFPQLDKLFEESFERAGRRTPLGNPYATSPLASDHFLIKKSWEYFKSRVRALDEQWKKIQQSKDLQISALKTELQKVREHSVEVEEENRLLRSLDHNIIKARIEDHTGFNRKNENLRVRWDAEREVLQRKIDEFEFKMLKAKKEFEARLLIVQSRESKLKDEIVGLKREAGLQTERERDMQFRFTDQMNQQMEAIQSLENKISILKGEVDRRDLIIKQLNEAVTNNEKDNNAMIKYVEELQRALRDKDMEIHHLKTRADILRQEKDNMRSSWEREQAEWRELWDRGREAWERKK